MLTCTYRSDFIPLSVFRRLTHLVVFVGDLSWEEIISSLSSVRSPLRILELRGVLVRTESPSEGHSELTDTQVQHNTAHGIVQLDACLELAAFRDLETMKIVFADEGGYLEFSVRGHGYMWSTSSAKSIVELGGQDTKGRIMSMLPKLHLRGVEIVVEIDAAYVWLLFCLAQNTDLQIGYTLS